MNSTFLYHVIQKGLDMAIVNPKSIQHYEEIDFELRKKVEAVIFNLGENPTQDLIEYSEECRSDRNGGFK